MKYGDGALGGKAGMLKHLKDMDSLITNKESYANNGACDRESVQPTRSTGITKIQ